MCLSTITNLCSMLLDMFSTLPFFFYCAVAHRVLHSFPTRRSSDLRVASATDSARVSSSFVQTAPGSTRTGTGDVASAPARSEEHTSELQSHSDLVCRLLLEKKKIYNAYRSPGTPIVCWSSI